MTSSNFKIECTCGYCATYDNYSTLTSKHFKNLEQWNVWQRGALEKIKNEKSENMIFEDSNITLSSVESSSHDNFTQIDFGTAKLYRGKVVFEGTDSHEFDTSLIWGCNIQRNDCFEFNYDKTTYLFTMNGKDNAYKWKEYMEL